MKKKYKKLVKMLTLGGVLVALLFFTSVSFRKINETKRQEYSLDQEEIAKDQELQELEQKQNTTTSTVSIDKKSVTTLGILTYHFIGQDNKNKYGRYSVVPENFYKQILFLKEQGYEFVTMAQAMGKFRANASSTKPLFQKTIVLTFDDGYRNFYTNAYPFLKEHNIPATLYVIIQDIGKRGNVSWDMMREMQASGLVEIGSHTMHHKNLSKVSENAARYEIFESKKILEEKLGTKISTLAYPYGAYNLAAAKLAEQAGYIGAARVMAGHKPAGNNLYAWRRVSIYNEDAGAQFLRKIYTAFEVIK